MAKLLVVENEFVVASELERILDEAGHRVIGLAPDTAAAVRLAEQERPDLAIVDLKLAVNLDGLKTAAIIAERFGSRIVISTGYMDRVIDEASIRVHPCAVLRKPYTKEAVLAAVEKCLAPSR